MIDSVCQLPYISFDVAVCLMSVDQGGIYVEGIGANSLVLSAFVVAIL